MDVVNQVRVLVIDCRPSSGDEKYELAPCIEFQEYKNNPLYIRLLENPTVEDLQSSLTECKPEIVYCYGGITPHRDLLYGQQNSLAFPENHAEGLSPDDPAFLAQLFKGHEIHILYIDAPLSPTQVEEMKREKCFGELIYWPLDCFTCAGFCEQFAHCFFAMLRIHGVTFSEAFAFATRSIQLLCDGVMKDKPNVQLFPSYLSPAEPDLPQSHSVPVEPIPGIQFLENEDIPDVEGWEEVLLLAPKAELRALVCGGSSTIDVARLSSLGEALRALLVVEMRSLLVTEVMHCDRVPSNLSINSAAVKCQIKSSSGIETVVVLGGPPSILSNQYLIQHALRQTLTVDSLCLQFRLPSPSLPATIARSSSFVAGGVPVVDTLIHTSVWAVHVLRGLAQDENFRGLVSLGVAGIGGNALVPFKPSDTLRYNTIVTGMSNEALIPKTTETQSEEKNNPEPLSSVKVESHVYSANAEAELELIEGRDLVCLSLKCFVGLDHDYEMNMEAEGDYEEGSRLGNDHSFLQIPSLEEIDFQSTRPPLNRCTESEFYSDLVAFLQTCRGKVLDEEKFPEAVLNGVQLDLFNLYKEVVSRGGFRVGNGINWKGQVFPKMKNWTANHRMTGVGNALKRHYQGYLLEYEMFHSEDLTGGGCWLCGSSDEVGADWICCDSCERWVHFACDGRPFLGTFKDYATGDGRTYHCPRCSEFLKRQRTNV